MRKNTFGEVHPKDRKLYTFLRLKDLIMDLVAGDKNSTKNFLHGEVLLFNLFVLFQLRNAPLVFYGPVIHDISPVCMLESKFGVLLGEKDGHPYLQSAHYLSFIVSLKFLLLSHLH